MQKLTSSGNIGPFDWSILEKGHEGQLPDNSPCFIHSSDFGRLLPEAGSATVGIWLDSEDSLDEISSDIQQVPAIAINFPVFADGRGFSLAQQLRFEKGYKGEIYAIGQFMEEQLFYLKRCGFDTFAIADGSDIESLKAILNDFSNSYQGSSTEAKPLFKRRA